MGRVWGRVRIRLAIQGKGSVSCWGNEDEVLEPSLLIFQSALER